MAIDWNLMLNGAIAITSALGIGGASIFLFQKLKVITGILLKAQAIQGYLDNITLRDILEMLQMTADLALKDGDLDERDLAALGAAWVERGKV